MTEMAERPTGALREEPEEAPEVFDPGLDTATPELDDPGPAGWSAAHFSAGGGEAESDAGDTVIVEADGTVTTFLAGEAGVASPETAAWAAEGDRTFGYDTGTGSEDED